MDDVTVAATFRVGHSWHRTLTAIAAQIGPGEPPALPLELSIRWQPKVPRRLSRAEPADGLDALVKEISRIIAGNVPVAEPSNRAMAVFEPMKEQNACPNCRLAASFPRFRSSSHAIASGTAGGFPTVACR